MHYETGTANIIACFDIKLNEMVSHQSMKYQEFGTVQKSMLDSFNSRLFDTQVQFERHVGEIVQRQNEITKLEYKEI